MPFPRFWFILIFSSFFAGKVHASTPKITPDSISWSNSVEMSDQASLTAQTELLNARSTLQRDSYLHQMNVTLFQQQALPEEEFKTSQWRVDRDRLTVAIAEARLAEAAVNQGIAKMHLAFELGTTENVVTFAEANVNLWQTRLELARTEARLRQVDREYRKYEFEMARKLTTAQADTQSHLILMTNEYELATNFAALASSIELHAESALNRANVTFHAIKGSAKN